MINILNSYLIQHKNISIPGLGTIYLEKVPAMNDFTNHRILPVTYRFRFDKYFDAPDKEFFSFLAASQEIPEYEAIKQYNEFAFELRNNIRKEEHFNWPGVGTLLKDGSGEIQFRSESMDLSFIQPVPANRVIRQDTRHVILVGDQELTTQDMSELLNEEHVYVEKESWWIYALILFAIALSILFFYFYRNGWQLVLN